MTSTKFRYIGTTDECVQCQKCGRSDLTSTVVLAILDADGNDEEITYFGSVCAARALKVRGGGRAVLDSARRARQATLDAACEARDMLAYYDIPETGDVDDLTMAVAMKRYGDVNPGAVRASLGVSDMRRFVLDMIARKRAAIADAALLERPLASSGVSGGES